jgi:hypothetical protein
MKKSVADIGVYTFLQRRTRYRRLLWRYATDRKVADSSQDEVVEFSNLSNPSGHTMALEFTQLLKEMSIRRTF